MTETRAVSIEDVRTLVAERQRYDDWLSALEARRAETPARVFERVYGDYSARRDGVLERLRSHESALASLGGELDGRLTAIESHLAALEDERAEAMLRTAVGEFDNDRWESVRREVEAGIASHTAERSGLLVEVEDVRSLLASTRHTPQASEPVTDSAASSAEESGEAPSAPGESGVDGRALEPAGDGRPLGDRATADALASTDTVAGAALIEEAAIEASAEAAMGVGPMAGDANGDDPGALDIEDALALFSPIAEISDMAELTDAPGSPVSGAGLSTGSRSTDSFDDLAFLHSVIDPGTSPAAASVLDRAAPAAPSSAPAAGEQQKTLRCTECGTMNLPTEWYCERCGGELAAF